MLTQKHDADCVCSPQDLEEFVEGSGDDGFIVFTLGSMVSDMPKEIAKQFFDAFRQIPQRVTNEITHLLQLSLNNFTVLQLLLVKQKLNSSTANIYTLAKARLTQRLS